jgi:hypothetical protein
MSAAEMVKRLGSMGNSERARVSRSFFKTGPGEYGEGDQFAGLSVPQVRALAKELRDLTRAETVKLLHAPLHEARLLALLLLMRRLRRATKSARGHLWALPREHALDQQLDLVDVSATPIVGAHLWARDRSILDALAASDLLWERRIAVLATLYFIRRGEFGNTLRIASGSWATARTDAQGGGLDAARGRQARPRGRGGFF